MAFILARGSHFLPPTPKRKVSWWGQIYLPHFLQLFPHQVADIDSSPSKEEEEEDDDTMQNTVVLFSNTDKFVLMQVPYSETWHTEHCVCLCFDERIDGENWTYFWGYPANEKTDHELKSCCSLVCPSITFLLSVSSELGTKLGAREIAVKKSLPYEVYSLGNLHVSSLE